MLQAVQIGAGNIGRGFLGQLLFEGGYRTTFVDANPVFVSGLNARGEYPLRLVGPQGSETLAIGHLCAMDASETELVARAITEADLISVAVGVNILPRIAPMLAAGLNARAAREEGPVNILLCENQWHAAAFMRDLLLPHLADAARAGFDNQVGLVETVIGRMVPAPTEALRAEDPLLIVAESYKELPISMAGLRAPAPSLPGLIVAEKFEGYEARKLFLHNMSHAALAYAGHPCGHDHIWQCAGDPSGADLCRAAISESGRALAAEYGFPLTDLFQLRPGSDASFR